jgi:hypothetical protein
MMKPTEARREMTRTEAEKKFEEYYNNSQWKYLLKTGWTPYDYGTAKKFWFAALESCGIIKELKP